MWARLPTTSRDAEELSGETNSGLFGDYDYTGGTDDGTSSTALSNAIAAETGSRTRLVRVNVRRYEEHDARSEAVTAATDAGSGRLTPPTFQDSEDVTIIDAVGGFKRAVHGGVKTPATNVAGGCATPPVFDGFGNVTKKDAIGGVEHRVRCRTVLPAKNADNAPSAPNIGDNGEDVPNDTAAGDAFSHGGSPLLACKSGRHPTLVVAACDAECSPFVTKSVE